MTKKLLKLKEQQDGIFSSMSSILSGLSSPVRIKLIHFLSQAPLTVEVLAEKIDQSVANTSMHLRKMLSEKILSVSVQGQKRLYSLHPATFLFWESCQDFIQKIDPELTLKVDDVYGDINWPKELKETLKLIKSNEAILLDVRPVEEHAEDSKKSYSLNIPQNELKQKKSLIPKNKPVLVFCRGRMCALSAYATQELREMGFDAYRLNESWFSLKESLN